MKVNDNQPILILVTKPVIEDKKQAKIWSS